MSAVRLEMLRDELVLASGTGFIWAHDAGVALITSWHNLTGSHPDTNQPLSSTGARPNRLRVISGNRNGIDGNVVATTPLYDAEDRPMWLIHRDAGSEIDIAVMAFAIHADSLAQPINTLPQAPMRIDIATDVFVIGFPLGISRWHLPIWKRASIALEPAALNDTHGNRFMIIDTATREGLSGAPVVARSSSGTYLDEDNVLIAARNATKIIGIYSGRYSTKDPLGAQLGIVWPSRFINDILMKGVTDTISP